MFWQEDEQQNDAYNVPDDVMDVGFSMSCKQLPIDHAWLLAQALTQQLPWLIDEPLAHIHPIQVAISSNGWNRPDDAQHQVLVPSRRTRLYLRLPKPRIEDAKALCGKTLSLGGYGLTVGEAKAKLLQNYPVISARYVASNDQETEDDFMQRIAHEIHHLTGIKIKKMLCGKSYQLHRPAGALLTRHLMIADLDNDTSIQLQQQGLGGERLLGCGLFLPHKGIKAQD